MKAPRPDLRKKPALARAARHRIEAHLREYFPEVHIASFFLGLESAAYFGRIDLENEKSFPSEKQRQRAIAKVRTASNNLLAAISELDEDAKWHFFGCVDSGRSLASMGVLDRRDAELKGSKRHASTENIVDRLFQASTYQLPALDRHSPQLQVAVAVSQIFKAFNIEFTARGFSRMCLEETFELAGMSVDTIAYWVRRAKNEAKNLP